MTMSEQEKREEQKKAVSRAAKQWEEDLINESGPLYRFRDLKLSTLDLTPGADGGVSTQALDSLLSGRETRLSRLFPDEEACNEARRRLIAIYKRSQENSEEKGIDTLFIGVGLATWTVETGTSPNAPVVLLPMTAQPTDAARRDFRLNPSDDPSLNPVLIHAFRTEHGLDLSDQDEDQAVDLVMPFSNMKKRSGDLVSRWGQIRGLSIVPRVVLGNFSYVNMPMVTDLHNHLDAFAANDVVAAIAGAAGARQALADKIKDPPINKPDVDSPESEFLVLDADSSQHQAINRILSGESLVVWGPPGTGKSQTIANLIAALIAGGKRVLFVAEKRAAIDVVASRLQRTEMSNFVMDMHGSGKSKREFASRLDNAIRAIRSIPRQNDSATYRRLEELRENLVQHDTMMHRREQRWGLAPFEAQAKLIAAESQGTPSAQVRSLDAKRLDQNGIDQLKRDMAQWTSLEGHALRTRYSQWANANVASREQAQDAYSIVESLARDALPSAKTAMRDAFNQTGVADPNTIVGWFEAKEFFASIRSFLAGCSPEIYDLPHAQLMAVLDPEQNLLGRLSANLSPAYRSARQKVSDLCKTKSRLSRKETHDLVAEAAKQKLQWEERQGAGPRPQVPDQLAACEDALASLQRLLAAMAPYFPNERLAVQPIGEVEATLNTLYSQREVAARLHRIRELESDLKAAGFEDVISIVASDGVPAKDAAAALEHSWLKDMWDDMLFRIPRLAEFSADFHGRESSEFASLDRDHLKNTPRRISRSVAEAAVAVMNEHPEETDLIRREAAKKRRHLPVRSLIERAPHVLMAVHPCWMMSPLLVSETLPGRGELFDVVIFDEASQIPPAEAICSLARAPQAVIAGDDRQLPPTAFFGKKGVDDDEVPEDEAPEEEDQGVDLADFESILDVFKASPIREQMLEWHYRSKDGRLIQFSNTHIYGGSLTAFPGIDYKCPIAHHLVTAEPVTSKSLVSHPKEVEKVVDLVIEHARKRPDESLGIIAFGDRHASNIEEAVRLRLRQLEDDSLEEFFSDAADERFFVKNIERVQGDERETIILSVGYHKDANGRLLYRFGPLNQKGGERRLNVAITRARSQVHLVSSFSHLDMDPGRNNPKGVDLLRQYIEFAASGGAEVGAKPSEVPLNSFELDVRDRLTEKGVPVTPQYGVSGFRIDFACAHPAQPGRLVLAIEADGASYHSAHTARDRDRLRQEILEAKGWRFHRIWSTAWFRHRDEEVAKAVNAWKEACEAADLDSQPLPPPPDNPPDEHPPVPLNSRGPRPPVPPGYPITDYQSTQLQAMARWILSDTLLRTDDELLAEMMKELGFGRRGHRIEGALRQAIAAVRSSQPPTGRRPEASAR